jgi:hypothetical protein
MIGLKRMSVVGDVGCDDGGVVFVDVDAIIQSVLLRKRTPLSVSLGVSPGQL